MKHFLFTFVFSVLSLSAFAQKATWKELDEYHAVMAATFHPAEEGNLQPVLTRAGELAEKATVLKKSTIPTDYQKEGVKASVDLLAKESADLAKMVKDKKSEAELKKAIFALHDRFHEVMEKCHH
jgi:hypothetical protein